MTRPTGNPTGRPRKLSEAQKAECLRIARLKRSAALLPSMEMLADMWDVSEKTIWRAMKEPVAARHK